MTVGFTMEPENQKEVHDAVNRNTDSPVICPDSQSTESYKEGHYEDMQGAELKNEKAPSPEPLLYSANSKQNNFANMMCVAQSSDTSCALPQQVLNLNSNCYHGGLTSSSYATGSGCPHPPGVPQSPATPGFLTGAGYHLGLTGGQRLPISHLLQPGQAGTLLHFAGIVGDKQKLAEALEDECVNLEEKDWWGRVPLVFAVLGNHQECVELLLHAGAKPDTVDSQKRTPLHFAAYKGYLGSIKSILHAVESRSSVSYSENCNGVWLAQDNRGVTPLHHAAVHTSRRCLQALLKHAVPGTLDTEDHKKRTPLHWAAAYGSQENVRLLIKHGANTLMPDQEGKTPLHWAAMSKAEGARECVRTLIEAAPSIVNWQDFDGITALHLAVAEARKDTVDVILSAQKCSVLMTDNQFRTALHWACSRGLSAIAARLLECGANLGAVDVYGATPVHYAAQHNHLDTVELLVRHPCVRDIATSDGHTPLMWAAAQGADSALTVMVRHGASLTQADPRGCTALHIAAEAGHVSTVGILLRLHAPPDACAVDGRTPLLHAARAGHTQIVKVLAKHGASLDHRDNEGQCALHHAVLGGHLYLAQILIMAGTSVNVQDYYGRTPLHMAAYRGLIDIMFLLLENRGDVNSRDFEGQSALHWAAQQGHLGAVNTLLDFHAYPNYTQATVNRYTPYDCACVAEHLEVAQVLAEAGGISVTKIMEIAATKIQAVLRGYLIRMNLRHQHRPSGDKEGKSVSSEGVKDVRNSVTFNNMSNQVRSHVAQSVSGSHTGHQVKDFTPSDNADGSSPREKREERGLNSKPSSPLASHVRNTFPEHGPFSSVSGQRRSKALATSIMKGAGKKTLRNLELPGLHELGIEQLRPLGSAEDCEDSDSGTETSDGLRPVVTKALHHSGSIASAFVTAGVSSHHHLHIDSLLEDFDIPSFKSQRNSDYLVEKTGINLQLWRDGLSASSNAENTEKKQNICVDCEDEEKSIQINEEKSTQKNSCWYETQLYSSTENQIRKEYVLPKIVEHRELPSGEQGRCMQACTEPFKMEREKELGDHYGEINRCVALSLKNRKQTLKQKELISHKSVDDSGGGYRNPSHVENVRRVMFNEDALREAEEKWKNKLATLTIQRVPRIESIRPDVSGLLRRPEVTRPDVSFSHSLVKSPALPPTPLPSPVDGVNTMNIENNSNNI